MENKQKQVIALGFFDGVHLGHQALMARAVERGAERGMAPAVFTFDRSPREFVTGRPVPLLTTAEARREIIETLFPIEKVIVAHFDRAMMTMDWRGFIRMLTERWGAGWLVAGHDFRFGYRNQGTPLLLAQEARRLGLGCDIVPAVTLDGVTVSSTHIRALLAGGEVAQAARFLGRPFAISGRVRHGKGLGSRLGAPTLNLIPPSGQLLPKRGVYVARVTVDGAAFPAVTNVGVRPTVDVDGGVTVESHLLDQTVSLYGETCRVEFLRLLRPEQRFPCVEALRAQITRDVAAARDYFAGQEK